MYFCNSSFFALASNAKIFAIDILVFSRLRVTHKVLQLLLQFFFFLLVASPGKLSKVAFKFFSDCYFIHMWPELFILYAVCFRATLFRDKK